MRSKTEIVVGILAIAVLVGGAFFAYTQYFGPEEEAGDVTVASVTTEFDTSGSSTSTSVSVQEGGYGASNPTADVDVQNMSRERYRNRWRSQNGTPKMKQTQGKDGKGADVSVQITFNLTTPNGKTLTFSFNPPQSKGVGGKKEFKSVMGPNELNNTTGTFHLNISIHVTVTPPNMDEPVVDQVLQPANLTFRIPKEEA